MSGPTVEVANVTKWFGQKVAVSELTLSFGPGVTGLLGPNGAGKTTLLRMITGLQAPSAGTIAVLGVNPRRHVRVYREMALVPEDESVYSRLTARRFVELNARLAGLSDPAAAAERALETAALTDVAERHLEGFSKGMRQRAKVAAALVTDPQVLVADEPLNGADPVQRASLIGLLVQLGQAGRTVIVSSHVLSEVERMAGRIVAMVDGRLAATGSLTEIRAAMTDRPLTFRIDATDPRRLATLLVAEPGVESVTVGETGIAVRSLDSTGLATRLPDIALSAGIGLRRVEPTDESLESVFRYLVGR